MNGLSEFVVLNLLKNNYLIFLGLLVGLFVVATLKSAWFKGLMGELLVVSLAKVFLSKKYHALHNVTLPTDCGTTQIDHIYVSRFGVFVVETKNMKGWIFGGERQPQWTQSFYKNKYRFQNPIRQNYKHIKELSAVLNIPMAKLHSVIVFTGDCTFQTAMPRNVTKGGGYIRYMKSFKNPIFSDEQVDTMVKLIEKKRLTPSRKTDRLHVKNLKKKHRRFN